MPIIIFFNNMLSDNMKLFLHLKYMALYFMKQIFHNLIICGSLV